MTRQEMQEMLDENQKAFSFVDKCCIGVIVVNVLANLDKLLSFAGKIVSCLGWQGG